MGKDSSGELDALLAAMLSDAVINGFPWERLEELSQLIEGFCDCWPLKVAPGDVARLEPLRIQHQDGAVPFRCKTRRYAPTQSKFLRERTKELEQNGHVQVCTGLD